MKYGMVFLWLTLWVFGAEEGLLYGEWHTQNHSINRGTQTLEKEYLRFKADHTFTILFLVTVQKGAAYVKDLRIEGTGLWKTRGETLVVVVKEVKVPVAGEVYGISQASLEKMAKTFHDRFKYDPIRILHIETLTRTTLATENSDGQHIRYHR